MSGLRNLSLNRSKYCSCSVITDKFRCCYKTYWRTGTYYVSCSEEYLNNKQSICYIHVQSAFLQPYSVFLQLAWQCVVLNLFSIINIPKNWYENARYNFVLSTALLDVSRWTMCLYDVYSFKIKVGLSRDEDERRVKMVRQLIGADCDLVRLIIRHYHSVICLMLPASHVVILYLSNSILYTKTLP